MIFMEDKTIKVGGVVLPGLVKKIEVNTTAAVDEIEVEGAAVKPRQAVGYEDGRVKIELILDATASETLQSKIEKINNIFRKKGQEIPQPIPIVSKATAAAQIDKVLFEQLTVTTDNKTEQAAATLEFSEYIPIPITATAAPAGGTGGTSAATGGAALSQDYMDYLTGNRGSSPLYQSPAWDDRPVDPTIAAMADNYRDRL